MYYFNLKLKPNTNKFILDSTLFCLTMQINVYSILHNYGFMYVSDIIVFFSVFVTLDFFKAFVFLCWIGHEDFSSYSRFILHFSRLNVLILHLLRIMQYSSWWMEGIVTLSNHHLKGSKAFVSRHKIVPV